MVLWDYLDHHDGPQKPSFSLTLNRTTSSNSWGAMWWCVLNQSSSNERCGWPPLKINATSTFGPNPKSLVQRIKQTQRYQASLNSFEQGQIAIYWTQFLLFYPSSQAPDTVIISINGCIKNSWQPLTSPQIYNNLEKAVNQIAKKSWVYQSHS